MRQAPLRVGLGVLWAALLMLAAACGSEPGATSLAAADKPADVAAQPAPVSPGIIIPPQPHRDDLGAECDPNRGVAPDGRDLIVTDPEVLAAFPLERTLRQIAETAGVALTPEQLLQRLFDTENTTAEGVFSDVVHCDDPENRAFADAPAVDCPRAEGRLAKSTSMFTEGAPDFFAPVALVNRFDLAPENFLTCGEYRIVYAKHSGRTDPQDRVLLIFEGSLHNSTPRTSLSTCRPAVELWQELPHLDVVSRQQRLVEFYFQGVGTLAPVIHAEHFASALAKCQYSGACGQIRLGQGMQVPFQYRQFRTQLDVDSSAGGNRLHLMPTRNSLSPRPRLWDLRATDLARSSFFSELSWSAAGLSTPDLATQQLDLSPEYDAGESAVAGSARPSFAELLAQSPAAEVARVKQDLMQRIPTALACPDDDPMNADALVQRVTAFTCAGCHAPDQVLSAGRKLGCGQVWPASLGETHIDERGQLSPALTDVFLPHRAEVVSTFLQACDLRKVQANLQLVPPTPAECFPAGTPITLADGSSKAIEDVEPSDWVLSFDPATHSLVPAQVATRIVRQGAERFVRVNDELVATDNHPFLTDEGWVRAIDLRVGATLLRLTEMPAAESSGLAVQPTRLARLTLHGGSGVTYNLHIKGQDNYFAGGLLVSDDP